MADYNSAYTGAQIDAAIGAVREKESVWDGKAAGTHTHAAADIVSGTLSSDRLPTVPITKGGTGATTAAAARTNLGAAAASHTHTKSQITDFPASMTPTAHASTHASGGSDPVGADMIGVTDATAAALGLSGDPTVDDALNHLSTSVKDTYKVGDTLTTARTDLGDKWLLCNGSIVNEEAYPELYSLLPGAIELSSGDCWSDILTTGFMTDSMIQVDSCIYAIGTTDTNSTNIILYYLDKNNQKTQVTLSTNAVSARYSSLFYHDGYVYALYDSPLKITKIATSSGISNRTTYTTTITNKITGGSVAASAKMTYFNGQYYIAAPMSGVNGVYLYRSDTVSASWESYKQLNSGASNIVCFRLVTVDDILVCLMGYAGSSGSSFPNYFEKVDGTSKYLVQSNGGYEYTNNCVLSDDSYLYVYTFYTAYAQSIVQKIDKTTLESSLNTSFTTLYVKGNVMWIKDGKFYSVGDGGKTFVESNTPQFSSYTKIEAGKDIFSQFAIFDENLSIVGAYAKDLSGEYMRVGKTLPSISLSNNTYTYIKAKE